MVYIFRVLQKCNSQSCARWSDWIPNGECSTSCGQGEFTWVRTCLDGNIGAGECIGFSSRIQPCEVEACPTGWTQWSGYSKCSVTCGSGEQTRRRVCQVDHLTKCEPNLELSVSHQIFEWFEHFCCILLSRFSVQWQLY